MDNEHSYRIHIQKRTAAGEWEDLPIFPETPGFVLLESNPEKDGIRGMLMGVSDADIALFLASEPHIRRVIKTMLPIFLAADLMGAGEGRPPEMDADAIGRLLCRIRRRNSVNALLIDERGNAVERLIVFRK